MVTVQYECADGSPFPVTFASAEDAAAAWRLEQEHTCGPGSPMAEALGRLGRPGMERAYAEAGLPSPTMWRDGPSANGFPYFVDGMPSGDEMAKLVEGCRVLVQEYGSALGVWRDHSLPRVERACAWLRAAPPDTPAAALAEEEAYAQHHTMVSSMITWGDLNLVEAVCADLYGDEARLVAHELSQGYANATLDADEALWSVARAAASDPALAAALGSSDPAGAFAGLRGAGPHAAFFNALDLFLDRFGWRAETWSIDSQTWREGGAALWAHLRQLGRDDAVSPLEARKRAAERRAALVAEITERLAGVPDQQARFHRRVERLASYVPVREERAQWQLIAVGSLRHAVLRKGARIVEAGAIDAPDDVRFLLPEELDDLSVDCRAVVAERRAEHERWSRVRPPLVVGGEPVAAAGGAERDVLRGVAASRGVAKGRARVVTDLADSDKLDPGDILVCTMTAPPWTPLLAIAAAVVTDTGDLGSHPAIAAREYGIPCVVGTGRATSVIPDGAHVVVDGGTGTVEILG